MAPATDASQPVIDPELARKMAAKGTLELQDMFESPADWRPESLEAAKAELQKRQAAVPPVISTPPVIPTRPPVRSGVMCVQHATVQATEQCRRCGAFMCPTCDFSFPGDVHYCPACVSRTEDGLDSRRKKFLIASFALAAWSTVGMTCLVSGALGGMARSKEDKALLGWVLLIFVLGPAITGLSVGISTKRKRGANPATVWMAIIWNATLVASFVVLMIIGMARR
jgi:hypothetical protein